LEIGTSGAMAVTAMSNKAREILHCALQLAMAELQLMRSGTTCTAVAPNVLEVRLRTRQGEIKDIY
jgi:hypothetical protein